MLPNAFQSAYDLLIDAIIDCDTSKFKNILHAHRTNIVAVINLKNSAGDNLLYRLIDLQYTGHMSPKIRVDMVKALIQCSGDYTLKLITEACSNGSALFASATASVAVFKHLLDWLTRHASATRIQTELLKEFDGQTIFQFIQGYGVIEDVPDYELDILRLDLNAETYIRVAKLIHFDQLPTLLMTQIDSKRGMCYFFNSIENDTLFSIFAPCFLYLAHQNHLPKFLEARTKTFPRSVKSLIRKLVFYSLHQCATNQEFANELSYNALRSAIRLCSYVLSEKDPDGKLLIQRARECGISPLTEMIESEYQHHNIDVTTGLGIPMSQPSWSPW